MAVLNSEAPPETNLSTDAEVLAASRRLTRRSFAVAAVSAALGYGFCRWVWDGPDVGEQPWARRRVIQANASLSRAVFDERALAPTYVASEAERLRLNGFVGLKEALVPESWRLQVVGVENAETYTQYVPDVTQWEYSYVKPEMFVEGDHFTSIPKDPPLTGGTRYSARAGQGGNEEAGKSRTPVAAGTPGLLLTMEDLQKLPRRELVTEFKCVEGWSQVAQWGGVRFADFLKAYPPARKADGSLPRYVYLETPSGDFYVGYDMAVCRHPQTLLVTEMAGERLTQLHGAPLRLHTPLKYGYKQIKRIGLIAYTDVKPDDFWTKLGYDWYAGL